MGLLENKMSSKLEMLEAMLKVEKIAAEMQKRSPLTHSEKLKRAVADADYFPSIPQHLDESITKVVEDDRNEAVGEALIITAAWAARLEERIDILGKKYAVQNERINSPFDKVARLEDRIKRIEKRVSIDLRDVS